MTLLQKISTLSDPCRQEIFSVYTETHDVFVFPVEWREWFAAEIEYAICCSSIELANGLNPNINEHFGSIVTFLENLCGLVQERLDGMGFAESFTHQKHSEALQRFLTNAKQQPLQVYGYMRHKIESELQIIAKHEATAIMATNNDPFIQAIAKAKNDINDMCNTLGHTIADCTQNHSDSLTQFETSVCKLIRELLQSFRVNKILVWKYEDQKKGTGLNIGSSVGIDSLQFYCDLLEELIYITHQQLLQFINLLNTVPTYYPLNLQTAKSNLKEVQKLLIELLNLAFIVEEEPAQVCQTDKYFTKRVVVSLLTGKRFNFHQSTLPVSYIIIDEGQVRKLENLKQTDDQTTPESTALKPVGTFEPEKLQQRLIYYPQSNKIKAVFDKLKLTDIVRQHFSDDLKEKLNVEEEKYALYFSFGITIDQEPFTISTMTLPVSVKRHTTNQGALATAVVMWDNLTAKFGRVPFQVDKIAPWALVLEAINAQLEENIGRGLTEVNRKHLTEFAFSGKEVQENILWSDLCKTKNGSKFTKWKWIYETLKLTCPDNKINLKRLWSEGLVTAFISRADAENEIRQHPVGTFLIRFANTSLGSDCISIIAMDSSGQPHNWLPFKNINKSRNLAEIIKEHAALKKLYVGKDREPIDKDEAFKMFYDAPRVFSTGYSSYPPTEPASASTTPSQSTGLGLLENSNLVSPSGLATFSPEYNHETEQELGMSVESPELVTPYFSPTSVYGLNPISFEGTATYNLWLNASS